MAMYFNNTTNKRNQWEYQDKARCIKLFSKELWTVERLAIEFQCKRERITKMLRCHGYLAEID